MINAVVNRSSTNIVTILKNLNIPRKKNWMSVDSCNPWSKNPHPRTKKDGVNRIKIDFHLLKE